MTGLFLFVAVCVVAYLLCDAKDEVLEFMRKV